jgi:hypothetical protein
MGGCSRAIHRLADFIEPVIEQVTVGVGRHGRRAVPEHLLDDLDAGAAGDREAGRGVPELVRVEVRNTDLPGGGTGSSGLLPSA